MPKLSIITINYNNLEGLKRTVESVVNQTWKEFEYIVIDGSSTDGSAAYLESQSDIIDYWVSEPDNGIYNAMNKGFMKATGEYLLFLNSGDHFYSDNVLQKNHKFLVEKDLVYFNLNFVDKANSRISKYPERLAFSHFIHGSLPHPATFIKKQLFEIVGPYDEGFEIISDWKFFILALFKYNCSYYKVEETLTTFYLDGISSKFDFSDERNKVLKEYFSGFISDYKELVLISPLMKTNRYKMLSEIESSLFGKKIVSLFFRAYIIVLSKKKLEDVLK
ncbi:glycosyltransferase family 2 protein [Flavobacterium sp. LT1R49]|uniref:glycosyltransferase family 2 protein n=1 Tax=Flavobacterium arabinosi TaxID=3398737 RepID=UPI003A881F85